MLLTFLIAKFLHLSFHISTHLTKFSHVEFLICLKYILCLKKPTFCSAQCSDVNVHPGDQCNIYTIECAYKSQCLGIMQVIIITDTHTDVTAQLLDKWSVMVDSIHNCIFKYHDIPRQLKITQKHIGRFEPVNKQHQIQRIPEPQVAGESKAYLNFSTVL